MSRRVLPEQQAAGRFVRKFGQQGSGDGQLKSPWGVAVDGAAAPHYCGRPGQFVVPTGSSTTLARFPTMEEEEEEEEEEEFT